MDHLRITVFLVLIASPIVISKMNCNDDIGQGDKDGYCSKNSIDFNNNERRILLIGKTGVGKSTTGNTILGFEAFDYGISADSVTKHTQYKEADRFGKRLVVVDTPGLFDRKKTREEMDEEMSKWYTLLSPGIHAIILVVPIGRFTEEDQKTVDFFMKTFGKELQNYLIVVFTFKDRLKQKKGEMTLDDFVQTFHETDNLRKLIDARKRYIAMGYRGKREDRIVEVKQILSMVEDIAGKDGENYYSNEVFKKLEEILKEEERKRMEEIKKQKEKKYSDEEVHNFRKNERAKTRESIFNVKKGLFTILVTIIVNLILTYTGFSFPVAAGAAVASAVGGWFGF